MNMGYGYVKCRREVRFHPNVPNHVIDALLTVGNTVDRFKCDIAYILYSVLIMLLSSIVLDRLSAVCL